MYARKGQRHITGNFFAMSILKSQLFMLLLSSPVIISSPAWQASVDRLGAVHKDSVSHKVETVSSLLEHSNQSKLAHTSMGILIHLEDCA